MALTIHRRARKLRRLRGRVPDPGDLAGRRLLRHQPGPLH